MTLLDLIVLALIAAAVLAILFGNRRLKRKGKPQKKEEKRRLFRLLQRMLRLRQSKKPTIKNLPQTNLISVCGRFLFRCERTSERVSLPRRSPSV